MLSRDDITPDTYLRQTSTVDSKGSPLDYVGMVCQVSTDETGWFFQVRYLHRPGTNLKAAKYWSENLYEEDLWHFEPITLQGVKKWLRRTTKKEPRLPAWMKEKQFHQLRLFDDF